jgi:hypothetical protein
MLPHFQFYSKLEEKHQALEAEKNQSEARTKVGYFLYQPEYLVLLSVSHDGQ